MSESNFSGEKMAGKRSTMLTILCILSFIGSGWGIIGGAFSLSSMGDKNMQQMQEKMQKDKARIQEKKEKESKSGDSKFALKMLESSEQMLDPVKMKTVTMLNLIAAVITITGVFLMWRRQRTGFVIYIIGSIAYIGGMAYVYGTNNFITNITIAVNIFISILFIILYGMCLKEMNVQKNTV